MATQAGDYLSVSVYDAGGKLAAEYSQYAAPATAQVDYITANHQGSTAVVTDNAGTVKARHDYLPFGEEIGDGVGSRTTAKKFNQSDYVRHKYAGMETDDATGLNHTLWRKDDNWSGRWTSPDPYGGSMTTANPQSFNRYAYCDNDPVNHLDPLGLSLADIGVYQTDDPSHANPDWEAQKRRQRKNHAPSPWDKGTSSSGKKGVGHHSSGQQSGGSGTSQTSGLIGWTAATQAAADKLARQFAFSLPTLRAPKTGPKRPASSISKVWYKGENKKFRATPYYINSEANADIWVYDQYGDRFINDGGSWRMEEEVELVSIAPWEFNNHIPIRTGTALLSNGGIAADIYHTAAKRNNPTEDSDRPDNWQFVYMQTVSIVNIANPAERYVTAHNLIVENALGVTVQDCSLRGCQIPPPGP